MLRRLLPKSLNYVSFSGPVWGEKRKGTSWLGRKAENPAASREDSDGWCPKKRSRRNARAGQKSDDDLIPVQERCERV